MYKGELNVISQAILNEVEGFEFYKLSSSRGPKGNRDAFLELANEELKHIEYLKLLFNKIKESDEDDIRLAFDEKPPSPNIYTWEKFGKDQSSLAMSVFGIGMQMEKDSIEFYQNAKEQTTLDAAKELFDLLIKWEKLHLDQFTIQYNLYKEEWWATQSFSPF